MHYNEHCTHSTALILAKDLTSKHSIILVGIRLDTMEPAHKGYLSSRCRDFIPYELASQTAVLYKKRGDPEGQSCTWGVLIFEILLHVSSEKRPVHRIGIHASCICIYVCTYTDYFLNYKY